MRGLVRELRRNPRGGYEACPPTSSPVAVRQVRLAVRRDAWKPHCARRAAAAKLRLVEAMGNSLHRTPSLRIACLDQEAAFPSAIALRFPLPQPYVTREPGCPARRRPQRTTRGRYRRPAARADTRESRSPSSRSRPRPAAEPAPDSRAGCGHPYFGMPGRRTARQWRGCDPRVCARPRRIPWLAIDEFCDFSWSLWKPAATKRGKV